MNRKVILAMLAVVSLMAVLMVACNTTGNNKSIQADQKTVADQQAIYAKAQPVPVYDYSQTRASLISIYNFKTKAIATNSVFYAMDKPIFICPSYGFPIPADTQLTNPQQLTKVNPPGNDNGVSGAVPLAEPDGTYTSPNTNGTYVLCVRDGKAVPVYWEGYVGAFMFPVKIENGIVVDAGGAASGSVDIKRE